MIHLGPCWRCGCEPAGAPDEVKGAIAVWLARKRARAILIEAGAALSRKEKLAIIHEEVERCKRILGLS